MPYYKRVPQLLDVVRRFMLENGAAAAHPRRRDEATFSMGVTIPQVRSHVLTHFPDLAISLNSVRRLMLAPDAGNRASQFYHGVIDVKKVSKTVAAPLLQVPVAPPARGVRGVSSRRRRRASSPR